MVVWATPKQKGTSDGPLSLQMTSRCRSTPTLAASRAPECANLPRHLPRLPHLQAVSSIPPRLSRARMSPRPPSERDHALIERYLRVRGTRLARTTAQEYRGDLTQFAGSIGRHSLLTATSDDVAAWFHDHTRDDNDPADPRRRVVGRP